MEIWLVIVPPLLRKHNSGNANASEHNYETTPYFPFFSFSRYIDVRPRSAG